MKSTLKKIVVWILTQEAKIVLKKYKPKVVAVTGSVGKTTTKDMMYAAFADSFHVRKSEKSFNSELGVPLTILGLPNAWNNPLSWIENILEGLAQCVYSREYPELLVLEVGLDAPGDIERVVKWLTIDVAVFTRFPELPVHVEFFESPKQVIEEKKKLLKGLKDNGTVVINEDDAMMRDLQISDNQKKISFGFGSGAHVRAEQYEPLYKQNNLVGTRFRITYKGATQPVSLYGVLGKAGVYSALAAHAAGFALSLNAVSIGTALARSEPTAGRMRILEGKNGSILLDDSYNASPVAVESALKTLQELEVTGRKIAVLGDMLELGEYSQQEHRKVGELSHGIVSLLVCVGVRMKAAREAALAKGMPEQDVLFFSNSHEAGEFLESRVDEGDVVLIKGSQSGVRMERVTEALLKYPEQAKKLLVRQDEEWKKKA